MVGCLAYQYSVPKNAFAVNRPVALFLFVDESVFRVL